MITKLLDSQSFSKVWKTAVQQKFCAIVSKIWPRNICRPLREHILQALKKNYISYLELRLKRVTMWNRLFYEILRSTLLPVASKIKVQTILRFSIAGSMPVFWRSSRLKNCNKYFAFINMKHSRK